MIAYNTPIARAGGRAAAKHCSLIAATLVWLLAQPACAQSVAVVYPQIREPFLSVFQEIVDGINTQLKQPADSLQLPERESALLSNWLERQHDKPQVLIALGARSAAAVMQQPSSAIRLVGAITSSAAETDYNGISLQPEPSRLFEQLLVFRPQTRRVFLVHKDNDLWLIDKARKAAEALSLQLTLLAASNIQEAAQIYRDLLDSATQRDALWLAQGTSPLNDVILRLILEKAWDKHLVVFSSNPSLTRQGILFSLYPDNRAMGASLAKLALRLLQDPDAKIGLLALEDVNIAVNTRTAEHLGLKLSHQQIQSFNMIFPPR